MEEPYIRKSRTGDHDYYVKKVFFDYEDMPILFTAVDENGDEYLCDCVEFRWGYTWIIGRTNGDTVARMLNREIGVYDALKRLDENVVKVVWKGVAYVHERVDINALPDTDLPDKKAKLKSVC